jgi:cytochrome c-type biogenesis protein CcmH
VIARLALMLMLMLGTAVLAAELPAEGEARYQHLINELRCLVCQNQSIAESNAPLAEDLRRQVRDMIRDGKSDAEILDFMTARYGDFVLYRPPLRRHTLALWLGPFVLLGLGALALVFLYRRSRKPAFPAAATDARKLQEILKDDEP